MKGTWFHSEASGRVVGATYVDGETDVVSEVTAVTKAKRRAALANILILLIGRSVEISLKGVST